MRVRVWVYFWNQPPGSVSRVTSGDRLRRALVIPIKDARGRSGWGTRRPAESGGRQTRSAS
jgi:hypothetical protein